MSKDVKSFVISPLLYQSVKSSVTPTFLHSRPSLRCCLLSPSKSSSWVPLQWLQSPGSSGSGHQQILKNADLVLDPQLKKVLARNHPSSQTICS